MQYFPTDPLVNCLPLITIVIMGELLTSSVRRHLDYVIAITALISAIAAFAIPGPTGNPAEIATVLSVGALAMLAGHSWGLLIVTIADLLLFGTIWPRVAFPPDLTTPSAIASYTALVAAVPGLVLLGKTMPKTVELVVGKRSQTAQSAGVACMGLLLVMLLVLPAL